MGERKRRREKWRVNEWRRKKPLRDSVALCVSLCVCVCLCRKKKKKTRETRWRRQSYLYKSADLAHFALTSLSRSIPYHSAVPDHTNWFCRTRNGEIESLVILVKAHGNTCKCCTDTLELEWLPWVPDLCNGFMKLQGTAKLFTACLLLFYMQQGSRVGKKWGQKNRDWALLTNTFYWMTCSLIVLFP